MGQPGLIMPGPTEMTLAKLLIQGLIPVETMATHLQLQPPLKAKFIEIVDSVTLNSILEESTDLEQKALAQVIENINKSPIAKRSDLSVLQFLSAKGSGQGTSTFKSNDSLVESLNSGKVPSSLSNLVTPSILLASTLIDVIGNPKKGLDSAAVGSIAKSTIANSRTILQETLFTGANHLLEGTGLSAGVGAAIGLIKEYEYHKNNASLEEKLATTIKTAEASYLELHRMYAGVSQHYQQTLTRLEQQGLNGLEKYQAQVEEWLTIERFFNGRIKQQQEEIALVGSMVQELQSKRRIGRGTDVLNTALTFTALAGPPGLIASSIIKGVASAGTTLGELSIVDNAKMNHGVTENNNVLMVTDPKCLGDAEKQLIYAVNPVLALSGPELKPLTLLNVNIDNFRFTDAGLAKKMVEKAEGRTSCSFAFSKPLPTPPDTRPCEPAKNFTNDPTVKAEGKDHLSQLIRTQETLNHQAQYLMLLSKSLMEAQKPHPSVINFRELTQAMTDLHQAIEMKKNIIMDNMGSEYREKVTEGMGLIKRLHEQQEAFAAHITQLHELEGPLNETPFTQVTEYQQAKDDVKRERCRQQLFSTFKDEPKLRLKWLNELNGNLEAIEQLGKTCKALGKGRHIQNYTEAIAEVKSQIDILKSILDSPETKRVLTDEMLVINQCEARITNLSRLGNELDQQRINYLNAHTGQIVSTQEHYQEITRYRDNLSSQATQGQTTQRDNRANPALDALVQGQHALTPALVRTLQQPTVIDLTKLPKTDAIVTPNRMFFGLTKHEDMDKSVAEKVTQLLQNPLTDTVQVMPLRPIDEGILSSCAGDYSQLKGVIEGLKTEIQWVNKFQAACEFHNPPIGIANVEQLVEYYQKQIQSLQQVCKNKSELLGGTQENASSKLGTITAFKTQVKNVVHESLTHDAEKELAKAELALKALVTAQKSLLQIPISQAPSTNATSVQLVFKQRVRAATSTQAADKSGPQSETAPNHQL